MIDDPVANRVPPELANPIDPAAANAGGSFGPARIDIDRFTPSVSSPFYQKRTIL